MRWIRGPRAWRVVAAVVASIAFAQAAVLEATVVVGGDGALVVAVGRQPDGLAWGRFNDSIASTGWSELTLEASPRLNDSMQGYASGLLEGFLTQPRVYEAFLNFVATFYTNATSPPPAVQAFVDQQTAWMRTQIAAAAQCHGGGPCGFNSSERDYWDAAGVLLAHADGLFAGYALAAPAPQQLSWAQVYQLTNAGDLEDLFRAFPTGALDRFAAGDVAAATWMRAESRAVREGASASTARMDCSGLIKLAADFSNLWTGHSTFNDYQFLLRVFKHVTLALANPSASSRTVSFSARPGDLNSKDDFYVLSHGLTVIETSLTVFNTSLYRFLTPQSVPCWLRNQLANRLAANASDWVAWFARHASGTHNNEWIVTDYNAFAAHAQTLARIQRPDSAPTPPTPPTPAGIVWMAEEMPGRLTSADVTGTLLVGQGYVPSYNIPFFPDIFAYSGYAQAGFNYSTDPRAQIFRRDQGNVTSTAAMQWLMNANDWAHDPLSQHSACNAISARCDLLPSGAYAFGGIDAKVVDCATMPGCRLSPAAPGAPVVAISGPTHQTQPVFAFEPQWDHVPHAGLPLVWDFDWVVLQRQPLGP